MSLKTWTRGRMQFGGGTVLLLGALFGATRTVPLQAQEAKTGRNIEVGGKYACDCTTPTDSNCICIVKSEG